MTSYRDLRPGAQPVTITKAITSAATDTLIWRVPWGNPVNKVFELRKIIFNANSTSGGNLSLWDQDLSSASPTKNGSAGAALLTITGPLATVSGVSASINGLDLNQCPGIIFQAGITCNAPIGTFVAIEGQIY